MDEEFVNGTWFPYIVSVPTALLILLPLSLMTDMSAFRYVSLLSLGALLYTAIVLIVEAPGYYKDNID